MIQRLNKKNYFYDMDFKNKQKENYYILEHEKKVEYDKKNKKTKPSIDYQYKSYSQLSQQYVLSSTPPNFISQSFFSPYLSPFLFSTQTFEKDIIEKIDELKNNIPLEKEDFEIEYSYPTDTFIVYEKTPKAKQSFLNFLKENNYQELENKNIFIFTKNKTTYYKEKIEENWIKNKESFLESINENYLNKNQEKNEDIFSSLSYLLRKIINPIEENKNSYISITSLPTTIPTNIPTTQLDIITPLKNDQNIKQNNKENEKNNQIPNSLSEIFDEVSSKVGVPKKILEAVLRIETPSTFKLSSSDIKKYSTPNNFLPRCGPNFCSATGPMQMTIGIDHNGNRSCPSCEVGFCPNAWASYGKAINIIGNYSHQPNPCNIRDNIYAAAWKLKKDSGANNPLIWTKEQVFRAATRYYGSCSDRYRFSRLGGRTYCEYVWDYYQGNI